MLLYLIGLMIVGWRRERKRVSESFQAASQPQSRPSRVFSSLAGRQTGTHPDVDDHQGVQALGQGEVGVGGLSDFKLPGRVLDQPRPPGPCPFGWLIWIVCVRVCLMSVGRTNASTRYSARHRESSITTTHQSCRSSPPRTEPVVMLITVM